MPEAELDIAALDAAVARLGPLERKRMFASQGWKVGRRFFAFVNAGDLVVKLPRERVAELLGAGAGSEFRRGGDGPPMHEWVRLRTRDSAECAAFLRDARAFVASD